MKKIQLGLFFTRNVSLKYWYESGLLDREKLIYEKLLSKNMFKIYWFTYGTGDYELAEILKVNNVLPKELVVCQMPKCLAYVPYRSWVYSLIIPFVHSKILSDIDVYKTNQIDGSWAAVLSKILYRKKLLLRTGYTLTQLENTLKRYSYLKRKLYGLMEVIGYKYCDSSIVSSKHNKEYIITRYHIDETRVNVIQNYVDTDLFYPLYLNKYDDRVVYVGRLSKEKNLFNLIEAIKILNLGLDVYGDGVLSDKLGDFSKKINANVNFYGCVRNSELPAIYNNYKYYILPSLNEGMPKSLLEAMACGLICVGTNVTGINEVIEDGKNGILASGTDVISLCSAIKNGFSISTNVAKHARAYVVNNHSLNSVLKKERKILHALGNQGCRL